MIEINVLWVALIVLIVVILVMMPINAKQSVASNEIPFTEAREDGRCGAEFNHAKCEPGFCCSKRGLCGLGLNICNYSNNNAYSS